MVVRSWQILPPSTLGISQVSLRLNTCSGTAHRTRSSPSEQVPGIEVVHLTQQPNQSTSTILRPTTAGFFLPNFHGVCEIKGKKQMYKKKEAAKAASYHPQIKIRMHASATTGSNCLALFARKSARISLVLFAAL